MREDELRQAAKCVHCGKAFGHTGLPSFWRIRIERFGVNMQAVQRQQGLTMMLGGHAVLAHVMGADEVMAKPICRAVTVTLCEDCAILPVIIAAIGGGGATDAEGEEE